MNFDTASMICKKFNSQQSYLGYRKQKLNISLFRKLTVHALPLFTRGGDIISVSSMTNGVYEPDITALIHYLSDSNYSDFFIDIGANIGLSSCQCGDRFSEVHMFEPNPDCVNILKVNAKISLRNIKYMINEFALGSKKANLQLHVPYNNWGGAFIKSEDNTYTENQLSKKDGYGDFNEMNYEIVDIQVESAVEVLRKLFADLAQREKYKGVIKIDIEGYEKIVLDAIAETIPKQFDIFVIFENWAPDAELPVMPANSDKRMHLFKLTKNKHSIKWAPRLLNSMLAFFTGGFSFTLKAVINRLDAGTYILAIESTSSNTV